MTVPATGIVVWDVPDLLLPRFSVRHDVGGGVGYDNGFTYLQGWIPILQRTDRSVLFTDFRVVNFDNADYWEFNAGGGARWYHPGRDRIFGVNAYYDGRKTANSFLNQVGFGVESLGKYVDFRANTYTVLGSASQVIAETGSSTSSSSTPVFQGFNIVVDVPGRTRIVDNALSGFDTEVGTPIPFLERWDARAFVGYYHYAGGQGPDVNGVRGRLEAQVNHNVSLHFAAQNDAVLGTTISGGIAMHLGGRRVGREHRAVVDRLDARVVRDVNIIINRTTEETKGTKEVMMDPTTGDPIRVFHVSTVNLPKVGVGKGTVEEPFASTNGIKTNTKPNDIIFVHANTKFKDSGTVTLQDKQRLLGEGIDHKVTSTKGTFLLPRASTGTTTPELSITVPSGTVVTLAKDNEVSGIQGGGPVFVEGTGNVGTFSINRNNITTGTKGVVITDPKGINTSTPPTASSGVIQDNVFTVAQTGVEATSTGNGGLFKLLIEKNQFTAGVTGVGINQTIGGFSLAIRDNQFTNSGASVDDTIASLASQFLQLRNNTGTAAFNVNGIGITPPSGLFLETDFGTNPTPTTSGTTPVAPGSAGFP